MKTTLKYANISVLDVDAAGEFYRTVLELETTQNVEYEGMRWLTLGSGEGAEIVLSAPHAGRNEEDSKLIGELVAKGTMPMLVFEVDDLQAAFDRGVAIGADVLQEPTDQPWGPRDCAFRDPSGNVLRINQRA